MAKFTDVKGSDNEGLLRHNQKKPQPNLENVYDTPEPYDHTRDIYKAYLVICRNGDEVYKKEL